MDDLPDNIHVHISILTQSVERRLAIIIVSDLIGIHDEDV